MRRRGSLSTAKRTEQGSALIVTLLVIVAVTGLGALAFNTAVTSAHTADNFGLQKRAAFAAEVAMLSGVEFLDWNLDAVVAYATDHGQYEFLHTDTIRADITVGDFFGDDPFERGDLDAFFRVRYLDIAPARRAAEFDERFCYMRLSMTGDAGVLDAGRAAVGAVVNEHSLSGGLVTRNFVGQFYVGPVNCPGYGG